MTLSSVHYTIRYNDDGGCTCPKCDCKNSATCKKCDCCDKCCQCG